MLLKSLDAVGFGCDSKKALAELIARAAAETSARFSHDQGESRYWQATSGAGLWLRFRPPTWRPAEALDSNPLTDLVGLTPCHTGKAATRVRIIESVPLETGDPMAGAYAIELPADKQTGRVLPVTLEIAPFRPLRAGIVPFEENLQIAGFAYQVVAYAGVADYFARVPKKRLIAPGAVVPVAPDEVAGISRTEAGERRTVALLSGVVEDMRRLTNPLTGNAYTWMLLATERGAFDVLANPATTHGTLVAGAIVQAIAFLVGRTTEQAAIERELPIAYPVRSLVGTAELPGNVVTIGTRSPSVPAAPGRIRTETR